MKKYSFSGKNRVHVPNGQAIYFLLFLCITLLSHSIGAQTIRPQRQKLLTFTKDTIQLDTLSLQPGSITISTADSHIISNDAFFVNISSARIALKDSAYKGRVLLINYTVYPFNFSKVYSHKEIKTKGFTFSNLPPYVYKPLPEQNDVFGYSTLNRSGSFTRGISFGNNQDLVVNSFVDIQLSGKIAPDIEVLASLNDRNIPIQPEGTTAQIQNFDQKFIAVTLPKQKVMLGDLALINSPDNYFLKFNKKVEGITAQSSWNITPKDSGFTSINASITKGKWHRQTFNGINGNQGPYRLQGDDGELYVVVVAGTEKVYINGELLKRGEQNDYKIDYNTGELVFTPNRLITQYDRIVVEFQYADRNYQRYILQGYTGVKVDNWKFYLNAYHEQDNAQHPILATLRPQDRLILSKVGDSTQRAVTSSADSIPFSSEIIMYKRKDTLGYKGVFVFSTSRDSAHYRVNFSLVGPNRGNYKLSKTLANGKVYQWFAPKNGIPQGDYEPVINLVAPQRQEMFTFGSNYKFGKKGLVGTEGALSVSDLNTLSTIDDGSNAGWAGRVYAANEFNLKDSDKNSVQMQYRLDIEHRNRNYTEIERTRSVEFNRLWSPQLTNSTGFTDRVEDNLSTLTMRLFSTTKFSLSNTFSNYIRGDYFNGIMDNPVLRMQFGKFVLLSSAQLTDITNTHKPDSLHNERTQKLTGDFSRSFKIFRIGVGGTQEQSNFIYNGTQVLNTSNYKYEEAKIYLTSVSGAKTIYGLELNQRRDYSPFQNHFINSNTGQNLIARLYLLANPEKQLKIDFKYRNNVADTALGLNVPKKKENTYLVRVEYLLNFFKGGINTTSNVEISTGRELRNDFIYVQVAKGQGSYVWVDYNRDGQKQLNEFEQAPFKDLGEYIRVIVPSTVYVNTLTNQYQQSIKLQPGNFFAEKSKVKKFASRFSDIANISILNRLQGEPAFYRLNPFYNKINDPQLVSASSLIKDAFYFNRTNPVWGADYTFTNTNTKNFLVTGFDSRRNVDNTFNLRLNITSQLVVQPSYSAATHAFSSDYASTNNFFIHYHKEGGLVSWQFNQKLRFSLTYFLTNEHNTLAAPYEYTKQDDGGFEARYNLLSKAIVSAKIDYIRIEYPFDPATPVAYEILQGLLPGNNFTWNISWNQRMQNNLQMTLSYDGRKSESSKTVHVGKVNVTWFF